jgi:tRNA A-37 threonylcarbamoyl transferase component Bud32
MAEQPKNFSTDWISEIASRQLALTEDDRHIRCEVKGPLFERSNSKVFLLRHPRLPGQVAVKLCLHPYTADVDGLSAREQFETLWRTRRAMSGNGDFSVPEPYFLDEEHGVLGMEWIEGVEMTTAVFTERRSIASAEKLIFRAGQWLRQFHSAGPAAQRSLDTEYRLAQLESDHGMPTLEKDPVFSRAVTCAREMAPVAGAVRLDSSWIHGDFKTDNLIVSDERTIGLDINARHENTMFHDIAPFLNHLDLKLLSPRAWHFAGRRDRLVGAFLTGYGLESDGATKLALAWLRLVSMLVVWESVASRQRSLLSTMAVQWSFRRATSRLIQDLEEEYTR